MSKPRKPKPTPRFNWRGNRPRMGKRAMCGTCACLFHVALPKDTRVPCPACGEGVLYDVSYDDL